ALRSLDRKQWKMQPRQAGFEQKADEARDGGAENASGKRHQHEGRPRVQRPSAGVVGIVENSRVVFTAESHCGDQDATGEHENPAFAGPGFQQIGHTLNREWREGVDELVAAPTGRFRGLLQPVRMSKFGEQHPAHDSISSATRSRTSCMDTVGTRRTKMRKRKMKNPSEPKVVSQSKTVGR